MRTLFENTERAVTFCERCGEAGDAGCRRAALQRQVSVGERV